MSNSVSSPATGVLSFANLRVQLGGRCILDGVKGAFREDEMIGIIGANGSGKTTLLRSLLGLLPRTSGEIHLAGRPLASYSANERARLISYLPQNADCSWPLTVGRLVLLGRQPYLSPWSRPRSEDLTAAEEAMAAVDILPLQDRRVDQLSGGERSRALLARALAGQPLLLFADEPAHGLDPFHEMQVMEWFRAHRTERPMTRVIVLHNLTHAARYCDRLLLLHAGHILADGPPQEVLTPENLALAYQISGKTLTIDGEEIILPWTRLTE